MDLAILDPAELDAIRSALGQSTPTSARQAPLGADQPATPIAIIADDRSAERARPDGLKLAQRWAATTRLRLHRLCGVKLDIDGTSVDIADARTLKEQLAASWTACVEVAGRGGRALLTASGPMIEGLAARLLGGNVSNSDRPPSPAALRVFTRAGETIVGALVDAWRDEQSCEPRATHDGVDEWRRDVGDSDLLVVVTLTVAGATSGRVRLLCAPQTLLLPPPALKVVPASGETIRAVLGEVPVEMRADLGRVKLSMSELKRLQPGAVILLDRAVGDPLPVFCADKLVGFGRALVARGALAIQIVDPNEEQS